MQTNKLDAMEARFRSLEDQLSDPSVISNQNKWRTLSKEHSDLGEIVTLYRSYKKVDKTCKEAVNILEDKSQSDLHELAKEELKEAEKMKNELDKRIHFLLIPKDPNDDKNVILEIRAGTGGEEAALFAADLLKMYLKFAENKGWRVELADANETDLGGFREVTCIIYGKNAYSLLKFESGVHRVQRVPVTESQGRIHTSTVTVVALPEVEESEIVIDEKDLRIDIFHAGGHGGQSVNTTNSAIRITHLPTGIMVAMQDERSLRQNKERAMMVLRTRLNDIQRAEAAKNASAARKNLIGTGDRSEKIRTYNFPQDRVTDHRIHYSRSNVNAVMDGDIDDIISELKKCELDVIRTENGIAE